LHSVAAKRNEAYHWDVSRLHPECPDPHFQSVAADALLREEPDEEEDEGDGKEDNDDDDNSDGYSE
jgi:hypothetical protein